MDFDVDGISQQQSVAPVRQVDIIAAT